MSVTNRPILITGASGYIGGRLVPQLLEKGYRVRCLARDPRRLSGRGWDDDPRVEIIRGDVLDRDSVRSAMDGCEAAYYLVHSMLAGERAFESQDRVAAENFAGAAEGRGSAGSSTWAGWDIGPRSSRPTWRAATRSATSSGPAGCP
jgi:uncharacterized protein YbjT (DUF2867 family)